MNYIVAHIWTQPPSMQTKPKVKENKTNHGSDIPCVDSLISWASLLPNPLGCCLWSFCLYKEIWMPSTVSDMSWFCIQILSLNGVSFSSPNRKFMGTLLGADSKVPKGRQDFLPCLGGLLSSQTPLERIFKFFLLSWYWPRDHLVHWRARCSYTWLSESNRH